MTTYKTKVDLWLICTIIGVTVIPVLPVIIYDFSWIIVLILSFILCVSLYAIFSISYTIHGCELTVKCGVFSKSVYNIQEVTSIKDTNTILSSPASSLERIAIYFSNQRTPLILSPKDKMKFINELKSINRGIIYSP